MRTLISDLSYNPAFPAEWEGLGYESAEACTPRWYGVSTGNGNDGISHFWPSYYVRTSDPWTLARAAIVAECGDREFALEAFEVNGDADYTIHAVIYDPPDDDSDLDPSQCEEGEDCEGCDQCVNEESSWSSVNGAWLLVDVFAVGTPHDWDDRSTAPEYDSLESAIDSTTLAMVRESNP